MDAFHEMAVKEKNSAAPGLVAALKAREIECEEKLKGIIVPPPLREWAAVMTVRTGSETVKVGHNQLPWITALLVVRYGEATNHWPAAFTPDDLKRAYGWQQGRIPGRVAWAQQFYGN